MTVLTDVQLRTLASAPAPLAAQLVGPFNARMDEGQINTPLRRAHFLAQCCYESGYFERLAENLNYTHAARIAKIWPRLASRAGALAGNPEALANASYSGKFGNGDEASGDGWRYRGRGLLQHTFKDNYAELGRGLGIDLVADPDKLLDPDIAVQAAIFYFTSRGCLAPADDDDISGVTRRINTALEGLSDRAILKHRALTMNL